MPLLKPLKLLIVEDNPHIARQLGDFLSGLAWQVDFACTGKLAIQLASTVAFDVVLLDLNLPDIDGLQVCREIKAQAVSNVPVLMLTARDAFDDMARGFAEGADDYLSKPFDFREVALRCQALSRRQQLHTQQELQLGPLRLLLREKRAEYAGQSLDLTQVGFKILCQLAQNFPDAVSRSQLQQAIWGATPPLSDALKSHIYSLRKQLLLASGRELLRTVHQLGYQLCLSEENRENNDVRQTQN
jgi:DNA-binding response OmpR family regulator